MRITPLLLALALLLVPALARADAPSPELMKKLAAYAAAFEQETARASYAVEGEMDLLDGDGKVDSKDELLGRVESNGHDTHFEVVRYVEDGHDKTADAVAKARESDERRKKKRATGRQLEMPISDGQQARYVFDQVETDGTRARITFVPKEPADDTVEGSAWVDTEKGTVLSAGFKLSRTPFLVDFVHFSIEFGARTPLGPAPSTVRVEGKGGIPLFRKHFVATAHLSDYVIR